MKRFAQNFILIIAAATVFFTGAGVTIINYCCNSCSEQTLFMTEQHTCCSLEHQKAEQKGDCCSMHKDVSHNESCEDTSFTQDISCTTSRLSIDIDASSFRPIVSVPFVWISDVSPTIPLSILTDNSLYTQDNSIFESPPDIPPREYLSLIRVLII